MHCGKFQDALEPLLSWLADTEELISNQKPPSAEYKVVKAQIQEQKVSRHRVTTGSVRQVRQDALHSQTVFWGPAVTAKPIWDVHKPASFVETS